MREIPRNNQIKEKSKIARDTSEKIKLLRNLTVREILMKQSNNGEI